MKLLFAVVIAAAAGLMGCPHHHLHHPHPGLIGVKIAGPLSCAHHAGCGHYHYGGHWYHAAGHHHGHGCGHMFRGGMWVLVD